MHGQPGLAQQARDPAGWQPVGVEGHPVTVGLLQVHPSSPAWKASSRWPPGLSTRPNSANVTGSRCGGVWMMEYQATMPPSTPSARSRARGLFEDVTLRHFDWPVTYGAEEYICLLNTFSGHIAMASWQRARLSSEIRRRLAERPSGRLRRHWGAVLQVARRLDEPAPPA
jgi:hypothetical protein